MKTITLGKKASSILPLTWRRLPTPPILSDDTNYDQEYDELKAHGPCVPSFLTDTKKVWSILLACFSISSTWQHVKKFAAQQNGRQPWRTLHNHCFGGDKVNIMCSDILLTLKSLHYSGDRKNFNFVKYYTAHLEQHNHHATLTEYGVTPLEETMKINYFDDGISDSYPLPPSRAQLWWTARSFKILML